MTLTTEVPFRILPRLTDRNRDFWTGGRDGELRFQRCQDCGYYIHPPTPICPKCHSKDLDVRGGVGPGDGATRTRSTTSRGCPGPSCRSSSRSSRSPSRTACGSRRTSSNCPPDDVTIGMPVQVTFEHHDDDDVWIPLFEPVEARRDIDASLVIERRA